MRSFLSCLMLLVLCIPRAAEVQGADNVVSTLAAGKVLSHRVIVIAHRGDSKVAPENTLPAFESAVKVGADLVELDYHHSADGVPVVFHDRDLDRHTNAVALWGGQKIPLASKTLAELRTLDAGSWFGPQFTATRLATLDEALDTIQKGSVTLIERKSGDAATCINLLKKKRLDSKTVVQAFDWDFLKECHRLAPGLMLGALGEKEITEARLDEIVATGAQVVGWNSEHLTKQGIEAIHSRKLKAWSWTVDDPRRAAELIGFGLDGLITNQPAEMKKLVAEQAKRS
ncbi:MAG TPA: glycerophosphodiester phosphodiesterase family protein [Pirellulales bacterium]